MNVEIKESKLTDGSIVHDVIVGDGYGPIVKFAAANEQCAQRLVAALDYLNIVGVELVRL